MLDQIVETCFLEGETQSTAINSVKQKKISSFIIPAEKEDALKQVVSCLRSVELCLSILI